MCLVYVHIYFEGDAYSMKTYQSITSLATSPAISSNSLYSNGFFVTTTPPPPTTSTTTTTLTSISNINSSSTSTTTGTTITTNSSDKTPMSMFNKRSTPTTIAQESSSLASVQKGLEHIDRTYQIPNGDHLFGFNNKDERFDDEQNVSNDDINILITNYDQKQLKHCQNYKNKIQVEDQIDDDDDELSVENTRL